MYNVISNYYDCIYFYLLAKISEVDLDQPLAW